MATVRRDPVYKLRKFNPEDDILKITCPFLEDKGEIPEKLKIHFKVYKQPSGKREKKNSVLSLVRTQKFSFRKHYFSFKNLMLGVYRNKF